MRGGLQAESVFRFVPGANQVKQVRQQRLCITEIGVSKKVGLDLARIDGIDRTSMNNPDGGGLP